MTYAAKIHKLYMKTIFIFSFLLFLSLFNGGTYNSQGAYELLAAIAVFTQVYTFTISSWIATEADEEIRKLSAQQRRTAPVYDKIPEVMHSI